MVQKAEYELNMNPSEHPLKAKGEIYGNFGIDKRDTGYFVLTHVPSGMLVCSASRKKDLVGLLDDDEFGKDCWTSPSKADINRLSKVIGKFYTKKSK